MVLISIAFGVSSPPFVSRVTDVEEQPIEVDLEQTTTWHWRVVVVGDGWTDEHAFVGPRWLAKRHCHRVFHDRRFAKN